MPIEKDKEILGGCYCGEVRFLVHSDAHPLLSGYCHCVGCRQAHAAPIYEVAWIPTANFRITQGRERLKWYTRSEKKREHLRRYFCVNCGTKVFNSFEGPFKGQHVSVTGVFQPLFDDQLLARSERWAPRMHMYSEESLIDLSQLNDGLPKVPKGADAS
jgi:hypothetical protein